MVSAAAKRPRGPDLTHYPVEDDMGEALLQRLIADLLRHLIARWLESRGVVALTGASQFIYWVQYEPTKCVAPDVYVLPGVAPGTEVTAWKVWETGLAPSIAVEVVSRNVAKDYEQAPRRYEELGVPELVIFDPEYEDAPDRWRWQVFRRDAKGRWIVRRTNADRVRSQVLGCWLRAVGTGQDIRIRLGTRPGGDVLVPTEAEAERARREEAEAEIARLRAQLARSRRR